MYVLQKRILQVLVVGVSGTDLFRFPTSFLFLSGMILMLRQLEDFAAAIAADFSFLMIMFQCCF